jgi:hypothetical protein
LKDKGAFVGGLSHPARGRYFDCCGVLARICARCASFGDHPVVDGSVSYGIITLQGRVAAMASFTTPVASDGLMAGWGFSRP